MPSKYRIKAYQANSYYHLYNRGVEKQPVFKDYQDFIVFLSYLKVYLEPKDEIKLQSILSDPLSPWRDKDNATKLLQLNNFSDCIRLLCFCLMPNHFHFIVKQTSADAIDRFMNSLWTRYTMYFNKKYKRVGPLFQSVYKGVLVLTDEQLLHLSRYIHRNPIAKRHFRNPASQGLALRSYFFSSYLEYLGLRKTSWVKSEDILNYFSQSGANSYADFVESYEADEDGAKIISPVIIEDL